MKHMLFDTKTLLEPSIHFLMPTMKYFESKESVNKCAIFDQSMNHNNTVNAEIESCMEENMEMKEMSKEEVADACQMNIQSLLKRGP